MILTCPECATRYFIPDDAIGGAGRMVRCSSCGSRWMAVPDDSPLDLTPEVDQTGPTAEPEPEPQALSDVPAREMPQVFRAMAEERRKLREAATTGAVLAAAGAILAVMLGLLIVFRADVVKAVPRTASAYAAVGLPVNTTGLTIEGVSAQPGLQDGHAAVVVTGSLRNIEKTMVVSPALRINLLGKSGKAVQSKVSAPSDPMIPPGETRHFTVTLLDPPADATDVEVVFDASRYVAPKTTHNPERAAASLRPAAAPPAPIISNAPPAVSEAQPITGDSPYALPDGTDNGQGAPLDGGGDTGH